ncbi:hypothetical protein GCM10010840_35670 [Deinococcus aerolatus]|uniref:Helix-turn-helix domain-containing protein n=1 Tax=Deinococcus aerolatus TaxID=522487 RepID=A0ABQ2GGM3_9DEIO|nr:helix-turn-helix domain-containing protein [Deinococcus aerolatus]GGL94505.1 hypothetical protein GCM10010840_35670 [Deinococcus aerolatus]
MKHYFSIQEFAEYLGVSKKVVYGMVHSSAIFAVRVGQKEFRISAEAVRGWETEQHRQHEQRKASHA